MLPTFGLLLGCQLVGEVVVRSLAVPIPGPVLGLALLLALIVLRPAIAGAMRQTVTTLLGHLSLLFVPAGVGVIGNLDVLSEDWVGLLVVLCLSTWLAMLVAVGTFLAARRAFGGAADD